MTTVASRARVISDLEGFDIQIIQNGEPVALTQNGVLGPYPYDRMLKHSKTVAEWKQRFEKAYPGFSCIVYYGDGNVAPGQTLLSTVRETYESDE